MPWDGARFRSLVDPQPLGYDLLIGLDVHSNLLRLIRDGGGGNGRGGWVPMAYHPLATLSPQE